MYPTTTTHIAVSFRTMCTGMPVRGVYRTSIARIPLSAAAHRRAWVAIAAPRRHLSMTKPRLAEEEHSTMTSRAARLAKEQRTKEQPQAQQEAPAGAAAPAVKPKKKTLWQKIKAEAVHYWHGTQLLGLEIRISSKLTWKLLNGGHLTRREHRQVK